MSSIEKNIHLACDFEVVQYIDEMGGKLAMHDDIKEKINFKLSR